MGRALAGVLACLLVALPALAQQDRFDVRSAFVEAVDGVWNLGATLDLSLSDAAREALAGSIPLELRLEVVVNGERRFLPNETVATLEQRWRLSWDALAERYVVTHLNSGALGNFATLDQALEALSRPRGLPLIDAALLREGRRHEISVRATLEIGGVPTALKVLLFWREWSRTTDWYTWSFLP
jgi:hypothetical protein